jgi:hypothetical protein
VEKDCFVHPASFGPYHFIVRVKFDTPPSSLCRDNGHDVKNLSDLCIRQFHVLEIPNLACRASMNANSGQSVSLSGLTRTYHLDRIKKKWSTMSETGSNDIVHHIVHANRCPRPAALQWRYDSLLCRDDMKTMILPRSPTEVQYCTGVHSSGII